MSNDLCWHESTVVYHIYVRSFKDSNNDGIGDLNGLIEKLDYLNGDTSNSLGIDAIWLSPIYPSPQRDFGYDVSDYKNIDPIYGSLNDFKVLLNEAHARGIKVMIDFVPNHTSLQHPWFIESRLGKHNPKRDFYIWADPKEDGSPPNNWLSFFGGSAWELDKKTGQYYLHSFDTGQPDLNLRNPEVERELMNVLDFWLKLGVDGFRVDAVECMFKDPHFRDEPPNPGFTEGSGNPHESLIHTYTYALPEVIEMIKKFIEKVEEYENKFLVTEVWSKMEEIVKMYSEVNRKWFTPFNFGLIVNPWRADIHRKFIDLYDHLVGALYIPTYVLGNHDRSRFATRIGLSQVRIAAILLLTVRGMPYIYYGDEIGMENVGIPEDKIRDPFEITSPGLGLGRDPERTPMQWDNSDFAGFSKNEPWLPVSKRFKEVNVEAENKNPKSLLSLYKKLISLKKTSKALHLGNYLSYQVDSGDVFAYTRTYQKEIILVVLNYSLKECEISMPFNKGKIILDSNLNKEGEEVKIDKLKLLPCEGLVLHVYC